MKMTAVKSSNIQAIGYDESKTELFVTFKNNKTFCYKEVSALEARELMKSESVGKHFNQHIKAVKVGHEVVIAITDDIVEENTVEPKYSVEQMFSDAYNAGLSSGEGSDTLEDSEEYQKRENKYVDYIKSLEAKSEWVSVDDRLPAFGYWYLISSDCESIEEAPMVTMAFLDSQVVGDNVAAPIWLTHNDNYRMDSGNGEWESVTHWMSLPAPPKGE